MSTAVEVTRLLEDAADEVTASRRRSLINRADTIRADDLPSIPLFQRPTFLYARSNLRGIVDNPSPAGPTWNAEEWWIAEE